MLKILMQEDRVRKGIKSASFKRYIVDKKWRELNEIWLTVYPCSPSFPLAPVFPGCPTSPERPGDPGFPL